MEQKPHASPACALNEAPDSYLGYLTPDEIAAQLTAIAGTARSAGRAAWANKVEAVLGALPSASPAPQIADVGTALDALLPKIRDDRLHATLKSLRAEW